MYYTCALSCMYLNECPPQKCDLTDENIFRNPLFWKGLGRTLLQHSYVLHLCNVGITTVNCSSVDTVYWLTAVALWITLSQISLGNDMYFSISLSWTTESWGREGNAELSNYVCTCRSCRRNTGKYDFHRFFIFFFFFIIFFFFIFFMKKRNSITVAVLDLKFCMWTGFHPS